MDGAKCRKNLEGNLSEAASHFFTGLQALLPAARRTQTYNQSYKGMVCNGFTVMHCFVLVNHMKSHHSTLLFMAAMWQMWSISTMKDNYYSSLNSVNTVSSVWHVCSGFACWMCRVCWRVCVRVCARDRELERERERETFFASWGLFGQNENKRSLWKNNYLTQNKKKKHFQDLLRLELHQTRWNNTALAHYR